MSRKDFDFGAVTRRKTEPAVEEPAAVPKPAAERAPEAAAPRLSPPPAEESTPAPARRRTVARAKAPEPEHRFMLRVRWSDWERMQEAAEIAQRRGEALSMHQFVLSAVLGRTEQLLKKG